MGARSTVTDQPGFPLMMLSYFTFFATAFFTAIFYRFPVFLPFFSPGKWPVTYGTNFDWQVLFLNAFHYLLIKVQFIVGHAEYNIYACSIEGTVYYR